MGYVNFYLLTKLIALPGVALYAYMFRSGLADQRPHRAPVREIRIRETLGHRPDQPARAA